MDDGNRKAPVIYWIVAADRRLPVTNMLDIDGEETTDPTQAWSCVARLPSGRFLAAYCSMRDLIPNGGH